MTGNNFTTYIPNMSEGLTTYIGSEKRFKPFDAEKKGSFVWEPITSEKEWEEYKRIQRERQQWEIDNSFRADPNQRRYTL